MSFLEKWIAVLTKPKETFAAEKPNASMGTAIGYLALSGLVSGLIFGIGFSLLGAMTGNGGVFAAFAAMGMILAPIVMIIAVLIGGLVSNIVYFILAKILGGKGSFTQQFHSYALFTSPLIIIISLLGLIPFIGSLIGMLVSILSLVLFFYSLKEVHELDTWKIVVILVVIPILILGLVIGAAVFWYTGVFNPSKFSGGSSGGSVRTVCGGIYSFVCIDQIVSATSTTLVLGNGLGRSLTVNSATLEGIGAPQGCSIDDSIGSGSSSISATGKVYIECPGTSEKTYDWRVTINYVDSQSGLSKSDAGGFIKGKVE